MQQAMDANAYPWAKDAFMAMNPSDLNVNDACGLNPSAMWPPFSSPEHSYPPSNFTIPALAAGSTVERYGQITPPEDLSPALSNSEPLRPTSPSPDQMQNLMGWPSQQQMQDMQDLANYDPSAPLHLQQTTETQIPDPGRVSKRRRTTTKQATSNQSAPTPALQEQAEIPQPPKRKRGRPKLNPQPQQDAMSTEDYPFHVSSARQSHLEKNRVAAHKCRQRRKEYIQGLENRAKEYTDTNKALKDQVAKLRSDVLELKNVLLSHAGCGCWAIDEYLAQCAGDLLGISNPFLASPRRASHPAAPSVATDASAREMSTETATTSTGDRSGSQEQDLDDYEGLELLNDSDDEDPVGSPG